MEANNKSRRAAARKPNRPQRSLRAQDRSRGASTANKPQAPAPALCHCKTGESPRVYAVFLQNAPVVRHTRGFTPGWYAVPRWGTPNAAQPPEPPPPQRHHHNTPRQRRLFSSTATIKPPHRGTYPQSTKRQRDRSGASIGTSTSGSPSRGRAKAQLAPTFPASAGPIPRSLHRQQAPGASPGTPPPQNRCFSSTATIKPPHRGTYPQSTKRQRNRAGASIGSEQQIPSRTARTGSPSPSFPASAGPIPRSSRQGTDPQRQPWQSATAASLPNSEDTPRRSEAQAF